MWPYFDILVFGWQLRMFGFVNFELDFIFPTNLGQVDQLKLSFAQSLIFFHPVNFDCFLAVPRSTLSSHLCLRANQSFRLDFVYIFLSNLLFLCFMSLNRVLINLFVFSETHFHPPILLSTLRHLNLVLEVLN